MLRLSQALAWSPLVVGNLSELAVAASRFDIIACAETKVTRMQHVSELRLPGFSAPILC